ncbi:MAG: trypsin-like serine protease [Myxococcota bacterium]
MNTMHHRLTHLSCCSLVLVLGMACDPVEREQLNEQRLEADTVTVEQFPWHVSVQDTESTSHHCAGAIIGEAWVVTAANCVYGSDDGDLRIVAGTTNLGQTETLGQARVVDRVVVYPNYDNPRNGGDVALLHLESDLDLSEARAAAIELITKVDLDAVGPGNAAVALGWSPPQAMPTPSAAEPTAPTGGEAEPPDEIYGPALLSTRVELVSSLEIRNEYDIPLKPDQLGARPSGDEVNTCTGHEGGSLAVETANGWRLVGVDSMDVGCGLPGETRPPRVYAQPSAVVSWIHEVLDEDTASAPDSCAARCGLRAPTGCRCDALCVEDGSCCSDFADQC